MPYNFSKSLENLNKSLQKLPGVGPRSAQRMSMYLLDKDRIAAKALIQNLQHALDTVKNCNKCRILCDGDLCEICKKPGRDGTRICIVESPFDALAIEETGGFHGLYFVLLGRLSPLDGIGPEELGLNLLANRLKTENIAELIIATSYTVEGEATAHFISQLGKKNNLATSRIAQGVPIGGELEYLDGATLIRALDKREVYI